MKNNSAFKTITQSRTITSFVRKFTSFLHFLDIVMSVGTLREMEIHFTARNTKTQCT